MNTKTGPRPLIIASIASPALQLRIDAWRRAQPKIPTVAEALRVLVELGLTVPSPTAPGLLSKLSAEAAAERSKRARK